MWWYAQREAETGAWYYGAGGYVAALWTCENWAITAGVLATGGVLGSTMEGAAGASAGLLANTWITDIIFRWSPHNVGPGPHFHLPPAMKWHLPQQMPTWYHHSKAILRRLLAK
jgi:hypothetical protein